MSQENRENLMMGEDYTLPMFGDGDDFKWALLWDCLSALDSRSSRSSSPSVLSVWIPCLPCLSNIL